MADLAPFFCPSIACLICKVGTTMSLPYYCIFIIDPINTHGDDRDFISKHPNIRFYPTDPRCQPVFQNIGWTLFYFESGKGKSVYSFDMSLVNHSDSPIDLKESMVNGDHKSVDMLEKKWKRKGGKKKFSKKNQEEEEEKRKKFSKKSQEEEEEKSMPEEYRSILKREMDMTGWKLDLMAIPTPCRKYILVFSSTINILSQSSRRDFELYDIVQKSWTVLPSFDFELCYDSPENSPLVVYAYEFVSDVEFVIHTHGNGMFLLDISSKRWDKFWKEDAGFKAKHIIVDKDFYLTESHVVRRVDGIRLSKLPPAMSLPWFLFYDIHTKKLLDRQLEPQISHTGSLLHFDGDRITFCFAQAAGDKWVDNQAYITFGVWLTDLTEYREIEKLMLESKKWKKKKLKNDLKIKQFPTTRLNTFGVKLAIAEEEKIVNFRTIQMFSIPIVD